MGTGFSKEEGSASRWRRGALLRSCLGGFSCSSDGCDDRDQRKQIGRIHWRSRRHHTKRLSDRVECESRVKGEDLGTIQITHIDSSARIDGWVQENASSVESVDGSISLPSTRTQLLGSSNQFNRRLNIIPDHFGARLNRATSVDSSEACSVLSAAMEISDSAAASKGDGLESGSSVLPDNNLCSSASLPSMGSSNGGFRDVDSSSVELQLTNPSSVVQEQGRVLVPLQGGQSHRFATLSETAGSGSSRSHLRTACGEPRRACRRTGTSEPAGGGIQFGRTLSVGRLRDRVLRRNASSTGALNVHDDASMDAGHGNVRQLLDSATEEVINQSAENPQNSSNYFVANSDNSVNSTNGSDQLWMSNQRPGVDASNNNSLLHRATFLERRQRVRSQVHALQRLGSRFENLVGHDRSCILSGHYRSGHCLCRTGTRADNAEDDSSTRASISRIVMLAEALFEVLDEIHQQSVVLSTRPSGSSFDSLPAPKEDVERLPAKMYAKSGLKNEEAAQCHICLVEYDEGDRMRILPCHHEFHQSCIDKWLKEIHRVCPLCRRNICLSDFLTL